MAEASTAPKDELMAELRAVIANAEDLLERAADDGHVQAAVCLYRHRDVGLGEGDDLAVRPYPVDAWAIDKRAPNGGEKEMRERQLCPRGIPVELGTRREEGRHLRLGREIEVRDAVLHL